MNALAMRLGSSIPVALVREQADLRTSGRSTSQTAARMCSHVRRDWKSPAVTGAARQIAAALPRAPSPDQIAAAIWIWVKSHLRFVSDEARIRNLFGETDQLELLISPAVMLSLRDPQGDCDCFTMTVCALCLQFGLTPHVVCICCDPRERDRFSHVFPEVELPGGRTLAMDASHGKFPGWRVPAQHTYRSAAFDMNGREVYDRRSTIVDGSNRIDRGMGDPLTDVLNGGCVTAGTCVTPAPSSPALSMGPLPSYAWWLLGAVLVGLAFVPAGGKS